MYLYMYQNDTVYYGITVNDKKLRGDFVSSYSDVIGTTKHHEYYNHE